MALAGSLACSFIGARIVSRITVTSWNRVRTVCIRLDWFQELKENHWRSVRKYGSERSRKHTT